MLVIVLGVIAVSACNQQSEVEKGELPPPMIEPMGDGEAEVGRDACLAYVTQVCGCVAKMPELKGECEMANARPNAFEMNTRAAMAQGNADTKDRRTLVANARKIMRACIADAADLAKKGCPMASSPASGTPSTPSGAPATPATTPATPAATPATPAPAPATPAPAPGK